MKLRHHIQSKLDRIRVEEGLGPIREQLSDIVVGGFCMVGLFLVIMGSIEVWHQGKPLVAGIYICAYLPVLACFLFRNRIPYPYGINIVLATLYLLALAVLAGVGLSGAGTILLITFSVLTATFQGGRPGAFAVLMSVSAILIVGTAMSSGLIPVDFVAMTNSVRMESWVMAALLFALVGSMMVACISLFQTGLQRTIYNIQEKKVQLLASNRELEKAVSIHEAAQKELAESEDFHKRLFEASPTALYIQDFSKAEKEVVLLAQKGVNDIRQHLETHRADLDRLIRSVKITRVNRAAVEMFRAGSKETLKSGFRHMVQSGDARHFIDQIAVFTSGGNRYEGAGRNLDFQGNPLDIILRKTVLNRPRNGLTKILVSVVDVTALYRSNREKRRLEKELQQTRKMETMGTLAGGIAHDFNNILFPISGYAELLLGELPKESPMRVSVEEIYAGTLRARDLVRQILTFSRQEPSELRIIKIQHIIKEALKLMRATIPATIEIRQDIDNQCGSVKADPTQIHQIVMNLCTNAFHAMEDQGGELAVRLKPVELGSRDLLDPQIEAGPYVRMTVSDTGTGMEKEIKDKIFEPFFTTKEKGQGTGMGLSVIHGIVSKMGGAIRVDSTPGKGTVFDLYFPMEKGDALTDARQAKATIPGGDEHILLVDDEEGVIAMETQVLERLGYRVTSCLESPMALETFRAAPGTYDLVISDVAMPRMGGDKLALKILDIRPDIPILLCTGYSDTVTEDRAREMGVRALLTKPVMMADLARTIREILEG